MNNRLLSFMLTVSCASLLALAHGQEPPGCKTQTHTRKQLRSTASRKSEHGKPATHKVLDLRRSKRRSAAKAQARSEPASLQTPVIASPIYLPQANSPGTAITASSGFLYVVVGQKLYKVNEKSLKTVQVAQLGSMIEPGTASMTGKIRKIVASTEGEQTTPRPTKRRRGSKAD